MVFFQQSEPIYQVNFKSKFLQVSFPGHISLLHMENKYTTLECVSAMQRINTTLKK